MDGVLDILLSASFWAAAFRIATPLMFGVLGALICERSGVLNLGIEGIFTAGALAGWLAAHALQARKSRIRERACPLIFHNSEGRSPGRHRLRRPAACRARSRCTPRGR